MKPVMCALSLLSHGGGERARFIHPALLVSVQPFLFEQTLILSNTKLPHDFTSSLSHSRVSLTLDQ